MAFGSVEILSMVAASMTTAETGDTAQIKIIEPN